MDGSLARSALLLALFAALLGGVVAWRASALLRCARARARMDRARRGEHAAHGLLVSLGFDVLSAQVPGKMVLHVDGEESAYGVRADYLVSRAGRRFVAEVKTGARAPSLDHPPTRRQLLEYASAFAVDGVLLVDPEAGSVREVRFAPEKRASGWRPFASGLALGVALTVVLALALALIIVSP